MAARPLSPGERRQLLAMRAEDNEHHPLDDAPPPRVVPDIWYPEWVGIRMIEAFEVLGRLDGGSGGATAWPDYLHEFDDHDDFAERRADFWDKLARRRVTAEEISRCNEAIAWPLEYLTDEADLARVVLWWAFWRAIGRDVEDSAYKRGISWSTFKRRRRAGLLLITVGLIARGVEPR